MTGRPDRALTTDSGLRVALRPLAAEDEEFALRVFAAVRGAQFRQAGLPGPEVERLLALQRRAQLDQYRTRFPNADLDVVLADHVAVGYLHVDRGDGKYVLIDVALLPEASGQGIGSCLIVDLLREAALDGKPVAAHVEKHNPAARLWQRLGFVVIADDGVYLELEASS